MLDKDTTCIKDENALEKIIEQAFDNQVQKDIEV